MNEMTGPAITPDMKVAALLKEYPALEDTLYEIAPAFSKLRNPILRRTVAKATSLRQAAKVAGVELSSMINRLRQAAGQTLDMSDTSDDDAQVSKPEWVDLSKISQSFDARALIEAGEQPMARVMADLKQLTDSDLYELITPFEPAPLIDLARAKGFEVWSDGIRDGTVRTYFRRVVHTED